MTLKPEDQELLVRLRALCIDWANSRNLTITGNVIEDVEAAIELAARPDPRPSPVGREEVARWICRTVRIAQGFKGTAEYTLDDEVHNAWDDWLDEADDLLALFSPADGWRPIETAPKDGADVLLYVPGDSLFPTAGHYDTREYFEREYDDPEYMEEGWRWSYGYPSDLHEEVLQPTHWMPLPPAPRPPGGGDD